MDLEQYTALTQGTPTAVGTNELAQQAGQALPAPKEQALPKEEVTAVVEEAVVPQGVTIQNISGEDIKLMQVIFDHVGMRQEEVLMVLKSGQKTTFKVPTQLLVLRPA